MTNQPAGTTVWRFWAPLFLVLLAIVVFLIPIVANPGFFNHDEWQKYDHVTRHGLWNFISAYGRIYAGPEFGFPVRPLGFVQQGLASMWMVDAPVVAHLCSVLIHLAVVCVLCLGLIRLGVSRKTALLAGAIHGVSPLSITAVAWTAASFDILLALFGYMAAFAAAEIVKNGGSVGRWVVLLFASGAAMLSKETAIVLPGVVTLAAAMMMIAQGDALDARRLRQLGLVFAVSAIPVVAYLWIRYPALLASMHGAANPAYRPSILHVPRNVFLYSVFPWLWRATEVGELAFVGTAMLMAAGMLSVAMAAVLARFVGIRMFLLGALAALALLLPVLSVPSAGGHYLYAAGGWVALGAAQAVTAVRVQNRRFAFGVLVLFAGIAFIHSLTLQAKFYSEGLCQGVFLTSLESQLAASGHEHVDGVLIHPEVGVKEYVGRRGVFGREAFRVEDGRAVRFLGEDIAGLRLRKVSMTQQCLVR